MYSSLKKDTATIMEFNIKPFKIVQKIKSDLPFIKVYLYKHRRPIYETLKHQVYKGGSNYFINVYF